jgi:nitric oxide dioxygenase
MGLEARALVKEGIEQHIEKRMDDTSRIFYRNLFRDHPHLSRVFPGNLVFLNRKFHNMMATFKAVKHLEKVAPSIEKMGERHLQNYAVQPEFLAQARAPLLEAVAEVMGAGFTAESRAAWEEVYDEVTALMAAAMARADRRQSQRPKHDQEGYDPGLLAEIGGAEVIHRVHQRFYDCLFEHEWLGRFFWGKPKDVLVRKQTDFMVAAFGGEKNYRGDTPAFIHMHMFITDEQLDLRQRILREAILAEGLSTTVAERWLKVDDAFRAGIVKRTVDDCVLKCPGMLPIVAPKPASWGEPAPHGAAEIAPAQPEPV